MEEAVNNRKTVEGNQVKGYPFHSKSLTVLGLYQQQIFTEYIERWGHHERS